MALHWKKKRTFLIGSFTGLIVNRSTGQSFESNPSKGRELANKKAFLLSLFQRDLFGTLSSGKVK